MALRNPDAAMNRLIELYKHCHKFEPRDNFEIIKWADNVETWATAQVQIYGWTYKHVEQVVIETRLLVSWARKTIARDLNARYI